MTARHFVLPLSLGVLTALSGCRGDLTWRILFRDAADRDAARRVHARVHEGGCDGAVVFETEISREDPGIPARPLPDGTYGVEAFAVDANCQVIARACVLQTMPTTSSLVVTLEPVTPTALCAPAMCSEGVCGAVSDAGVDATDARNTSDADAAVGVDAFAQDAALDAAFALDAGMDAGMDAGADAGPLPIDASLDAREAGRDAPVPVDAGSDSPDAFAPRAPEVLMPWNGVTTGTFRPVAAALADPPRRPLVTWLPSPGASSYVLEMVACEERDLGLCDFSAASARVVVDDLTFSARAASDLDVATTAPGGRRYAFRVGACSTPAGSSCAFSAPRYVDVGRHTQDLNGDGIDEMVVTRMSTVEAHTGVGTAPATSVTLASGSTTLANVAYAGDYDADGDGEVLINTGAPMGQWELRRGDGSLMGSEMGTAATDELARVLAPAGDVDGDGYADFLVSAAGLREVRVQYGGSTFDAARRTLIGADASLMNFALDLSTAGDRDRDGLADVAIASRVSLGMARVEVFSLAGRAVRRIESFDVATGETAVGVVPIQVTGGFDLDGDARPDLAFGLGLLNRVSFALGDGTSGAESGIGTFGHRVAMGDLGGSGLARVIFGAPTYTGGGAGGGSYGHTSYFGSAFTTYLIIFNNEGWGTHIGCADMDGDGRDDLFSFGRVGGVGHIGTFAGGAVGGGANFRFLLSNPVRFLAR